MARIAAIGVLSAAAGAGVVIVMAKSPVGELLSPYRDTVGTVEGAVLIMVAALLPIVVHELGHLAAGMLAGMRFGLLVIGPVMISRGRRGIEVRLHRHLSLYGGLAACLPSSDTGAQRQLTWMTAGGPAASAVLMVSAFVGSPLVGSSAPELSFFLLVLGFSAGLNLLAVTVPGSSGGFLSDRARWQLLRRGGEPAERMVASASLLARNLAGVRPREWPASEIARFASCDDFDTINGTVAFAVPFHQDVGDMERAEEMMSRVVERLDVLPSVLHAGVFLEAAFLAAALRRDTAAARGFIDQVPKSGLFEPSQRSRAEAALLAADGDASAAQTTARRGLEELDRQLPAGTSALHRDQLNDLVRRTTGRRGA